MKNISGFMAIVFWTVICVANIDEVRAEQNSPASIIKLPAAKIDAPFPLAQALSQRRSVRNIDPAPINIEEVSQLCWAAQGVTDKLGHRTAPSALAIYPLELYLLAGAVKGVAPGLYRYQPAEHALALVKSGDLRPAFFEKGVGQAWGLKAPATFVITGQASKMAKLKSFSAEFLWAEAGLAAQNFFLQATALNLGSTYIGGFRPKETHDLLGLAKDMVVMAVLPVGQKGKNKSTHRP